MATDSIKSQQEIVIYNKQFGFVRAWAKQDFEKAAGGSAIFAVGVNSASMSGIDDMTINVNQWEIYSKDDVDLIKKLLDKFVPYASTR